MPKKSGEHTLEFLLGFNGHVHRYAGGYWLKFEITQVEASDGKPHGLDYSFTLHGPDNRRLIGFDNAHGVPAKGARFKKRANAMDHWHRTKTDEGRPYAFKDAETLLTRAETFLSGTQDFAVWSNLYRDYADLARNGGELEKATDSSRRSLAWIEEAHPSQQT